MAGSAHRRIQAGRPAGRRSTGVPQSPGPVGRGFLFLLILALLAAVSVAPFFPRRVAPAEAPAGSFSAVRALTHLPAIAKEPHPVGSPAQDRVREYLLQQLSSLGLPTEVQPSGALRNVIARLDGTDPTGSIVVLAHYDSVPGSPGAADNGSGVSVLLEILSALKAGPRLRNDVIALFDDSEEAGPFAGTWAFIQGYPRIGEVRVAIGLDTAVNGSIQVNQTGPDNGWLVQAMARSYPGGGWNSISGGGSYEYGPFAVSGIQGLELESNYPFREQHTELDGPGIVSPASVQEMGDQVLALLRELGRLDLTDTRGESRVFLALPVLGLLHYPRAWGRPLALIAGLLLFLAAGLALRRRLASWRGLLIGLLASVGTSALAGFGITAIWAQVPGLMGWETGDWPIWPEAIPPNGGLFLAAFGLLVLALTVSVYVAARRWCSRADLSLAGLIPFLLLAVALALAGDRLAQVPVWPVLIGSLGWILASGMSGAWRTGSTDLGALLVAAPLVMLVLPLVLQSFLSEGFHSVAAIAVGWALLLTAALPALDGLVMAKPAPPVRR